MTTAPSATTKHAQGRNRDERVTGTDQYTSAATTHVAPDDSRAAWRSDRTHRLRHGLSWPTVGWFAVIHVGALAAPWFFTWTGLALAIVLHWLTGGIGICLCFHRLITHSSFRTYRPIRYVLVWIGGLAGEGACLYWVANHRKHHAFSDRIGDPHSPLDGPWWSHVFWMMADVPVDEKAALYRRWIPDLRDDRGLRFLERTFLVWHVLLGLFLFGVGYFSSGSYLACSLVAWGLFARLVFVLHSTWLVNSASHIWGYRNYPTTDDSRNNWWVAALTYGEGWHNNHHAYPRMARHGHRWWEIDLTFLTIRLLEKLGLAWDVVDNQHHKKGVQHDAAAP
jgi:fatty-acid desaturase